MYDGSGDADWFKMNEALAFRAIFAKHLQLAFRGNPCMEYVLVSRTRNLFVYHVAQHETKLSTRGPEPESNSTCDD